MGSDPAGGGTNADGSKSGEYCSYCYQKGRFTEPDITCQQMAAKVQAIMKEKFWMPGFVSWSSSGTFPGSSGGEPSGLGRYVALIDIESPFTGFSRSSAPRR